MTPNESAAKGTLASAQSEHEPSPLQELHSGGSPPQWTQRIELDGVRPLQDGQVMSGISASNIQ